MPPQRPSDRPCEKWNDLGALQSAFARALVNPDADAPEAIVAASGAQRAKRFNVYRNNVFASLAAALAARFPVVERLVGPEFFAATALAFARRHPPRSPVLAMYGGAFADFLATFEPAGELHYLPDVARLEWARNLAYHAADAPALDIAALAAVAPDETASVRLVPHPAARLVTSPYPIVSIWATNTHDEDVEPIGVKAAGECALVTRPGLDVLVTPLPPADAVLVEAILKGMALGEAVAQASDAGAPIDLAATLSSLFRSGALWRVRASNEHSSQR
ncbi:MAG: DUF2063 domain-containing protein [Hyphomicrobiaceae bacterium]